MSRPMRRLFDLEFDEVSAVDRPANQHGLISIAKSLGEDTSEEGGMTTLYAENGAPVTEDELVHGQVYVADDDQEYVFLEDGQPLPEDIELVEDEGEQPEAEDDVEKGWLSDLVGQGKRVAAGGRAGLAGRTVGESQSGAVKAANAMGRHPKTTAAAGAGAAGVAGGGAYMLGRSEPASKSLGDTVLEQLSKAVTDADRDQIVAKMADELGDARKQNDEIAKALEEERDIRITEAFIAKAAEYNLPISPARFGPILKSIATVLDDEDLEVLDELLSSVGTALYEELGFTGGASNSGVLDEVYGAASELVGKAAGSVSFEQATVAMFETNPGAYEAYLAENGR
jgi:hypothetical protein